MGHLLYLLGHVNKRTMHKYEQESKKAGKASFAYAWVLDETGEERDRYILTLKLHTNIDIHVCENAPTSPCSLKDQVLNRCGLFLLCIWVVTQKNIVLDRGKNVLAMRRTKVLVGMCCAGV